VSGAPGARLAQAHRLLPRDRHPPGGAGALKPEAEIREALRSWILAHARGGSDQELRDDTPILDAGFLSSLDVVELVLFIENLRGAEVDVDAIEPEALTSLDTLIQTFFEADGP
jgi:acyl carrier protein